MCAKFNLVFIFVLYFIGLVAAQDAEENNTIIIPLNKTLAPNYTELYGDFINLNGSSKIHVELTNVTSDLYYVLFQVHSQFDNISLHQYTDTNITTINGTNVGLVSLLDSVLDTFIIENPNANKTVLVYISVHGYTNLDPIPGGCNGEFPTPIAPYLKVTTRPAYIMADAAAPAIDINCFAVNAANVKFYMLYLPEMSYNADDYFNGIRTMLNYKTIQEQGVELPSNTHWLMRRMISAYPGVGIIFAVVTTIKEAPDKYAVYVPSHTYSCPDVDEDGCIYEGDFLTEASCAVLLFIGTFLSFFGHRFFKTEMFSFGFISGFIITYILVSIMEQTGIGTTALVAASALSGIFFGAIWLLFWWLYGIPVVAVLLPSLNLGFLLASIFYYRLSVHILYLEVDFNFWTVFFLIMLLTALALVSVAYVANILCCAVLGGYATTFALDYFTGGTLKYIMINIVRRAVIPNYKYLSPTNPPLDSREKTEISMWVMLAGIGWAFQQWHNRGRSPFPPTPRSTREAAPDSNSASYGAVTENTRRQVRHITTVRHHLTGSPVVSRTYSERTYLLADT